MEKLTRRSTWLVFKCAPDDSKTTIYRFTFGLDREIGLFGEFRERIPDPDRLEVIKELKRGDSFEMKVTRDRGHSVKVRFTHR